jgi:predicted transporter
MRIFKSPLSTRRLLQVGLIVAGAVAGAAFGLILTRLGKIATGAPPATLANYAWNAAVFGALAAVVSPLITWSELRRVPLWRTVAEPLVAAVAGGCAAVIVGVPLLILVLPPLGLGLGFANLRRRYPDMIAVNPLEPGLHTPRVKETSSLRPEA